MKTAIIIGGGIAGCSTAFALSQRGIAVKLIERHPKLAQEASGNPLAALYPKPSAKLDVVSQFSLQGFTFTCNLLNHLPASASFYEACGLIQLAFDAREQTRQQALSKQLSSDFLYAISAKEASEIAGVTLSTGGLYLPRAGWVKPAALCESLVASQLITIVNNCNALHIKKIQNQWQVHYANGVMQADNIVICNANDIKQLGFCNSAAITAVRGQINFFAANEASKPIKVVICSNHTLSPAVDGFHSIGTTYAPNDTNPHLSDADTLSNLDGLQKIVPALLADLDIKSINGRVAWRSQTQDYMPLAGQLMDEVELRKNPPRYNAKPADLPWLNSLFVNAGHGSKGMITAPICGDLIASLIAKTDLSLDTKLATKLNPSRFLLKELGLKQLANCLYNK